MAAGVFLLNRTRIEEQAAPGTLLLDVIRRRHHLTGCKEACREGDCGACMVLVGEAESSRLSYRPATACLMPLAAVAGRHVVTIAGLNADQLNPIQQALVDCGAIQCGFCTPGLVVALTAFFLNSTRSDCEAAWDAVAGNLCRCTGYAGIKRAIAKLCRQFDLAGSPLEKRLADCVDWQLVPAYFLEIAERLAELPVAGALAEDKHSVTVGGGTDLFVQRADRLTDSNLRFLPAIDPQHSVRLDGGLCSIHALTRIEQLRTSPLLQNLLPNIAEDLKLLCSAPIRRQATLGGNLVNASPIADLSVIFLALDARLHLAASEDRQRDMRLRDFFLAYKQTALQPGEQVLDVTFDSAAPASGFSFEKVGKRQFLDIASVNSAMTIRLDNGCIASAHLSAGGVAPIPLYLKAASDYLIGKPIHPDTVIAAAELAQGEISPISDVRGSATYKRLLLRQLIFAHFLKLFPQQIVWEALHAQR